MIKYVDTGAHFVCRQRGLDFIKEALNDLRARFSPAVAGDPTSTELSYIISGEKSMSIIVVDSSGLSFGFLFFLRLSS